MTHNIEVESGKTVKLPTAGKYCDRDIVVAGVGSNEAELQAKYDEGKADGITEGAEICAAKHFTYNFVGDGSGSVSFPVPFEPDAVEIIGMDPIFASRTNSLLLFVCDRRSLGQLSGFVQYARGNGGITNAALSYSALSSRCYWPDGVLTVKDVAGSTAVTFGTGCAYTAIAVKYTEQTDKERITEFVNGLTGSGTASLQKAKVEAAFTDDEWAALIATKPNWTFTLV